MKYPGDFTNKAKEKNIARWILHKCSMCGYPCGFRFYPDGSVGYDSGCFCSSQPVRHSGWGEVAEHYNEQTNDEVIKEYNEFWGFDKIE